MHLAEKRNQDSNLVQCEASFGMAGFAQLKGEGFLYERFETTCSECLEFRISGAVLWLYCDGLGFRGVKLNGTN
ncbi:hypothetical protein VNO80_11683 [Phaseolus coccineus]|uniref:Uncharacterized protein n=1 Tax=Phaseolus coccineus TaxID=3886 RepID=A0AAN9NC44_PHACN